MKLLENLQWRYATKKFDPAKKVPGEQLEQLKEAVQLSASSYGLQLYKVLIIEDKVLREQLKPASWNQSQITDASELFVFCNYTTVKDEHIDDHIRLKARIRKQEPGELKNYGDFIKTKLAERSDHEIQNWTARQCYIALGNLLAACGELQIDACPIEGFEPDRYNEILGLNEKGLNATVIAAIGYRSEEDQSQYAPKVRKPMELLFEEK